MREASVGGGGDTEGGGSARAGALAATSSTSRRLRESLAEAAKLLGDFEREQATAALETYKKNCRQLIAYLAAQVDTSPQFVRQMEQVIEASYSNLNLSSIVTDEMWLRFGGSRGSGAAEPHTPSPRESVKTEEIDGTVTMTPVAAASAHVAGFRPTCSPQVDLTVTTPSAGRGSKRRSRLLPPESKRARHIVARNLYGEGRLSYAGEEEENNVVSSGSCETETEQEADEVAQEWNRLVQAEPARNEESGSGITWPCTGNNPLDRGPAFIQHLKTAITVVDAENCCPPQGMECKQGCARIRARMCATHRLQGSNARPCHNGMCCVWHDIDKHAVRCQNSTCEFKNRVGLRQAMHDIQQHTLKLEATEEKLSAAKEMLRGQDRRGSTFSQLESKIKRLEGKYTKLEDAVMLHNERERIFRDDLAVVDANCGSAELQSFEGHYAKKVARE
ncbi:unnamed protein product [Phytophthora lilii]|uniref:Unnamed protein product n=1 Tax=Phytophthora lilii TaxID=2077276 RepID=A0A9W6TTX3_9STRA|nr:unnamed protein product [Phytophthora lilii]